MMKETIGVIILTILLLNCGTCTMFRCFHAGRMCIGQAKTENPKIYCLAGMMNQPETALSYVSLPDEYERVNVSYSMFGFDLVKAKSQLEGVVNNSDVLLGISIGAKPIICADTNAEKILVNPCTHPRVLKPYLENLTFWLSPLAEIISYGLGWIAVLPLIPVDGGEHYSIALLVDQLYWIGHYDPAVVDENVGIVLSSRDEFLQNDEVQKIYGTSRSVEIDTMHGRTGDLAVAKEYEQAILSLLEQK